MPRPTFVIDTGRVCGQHLALCVEQDSREVVGLQVAHDAVAKVFAEAIAAWGVPEAVVIDDAPAGMPLVRLCQRLGIGIVHSSPFNPYPRGMVERAFRDLRVHLAGVRPFNGGSKDV